MNCPIVVVDLVDALQESSQECTFVANLCIPAALFKLTDLGLCIKRIEEVV
jgi:hypothetical protein